MWPCACRLAGSRGGLGANELFCMSLKGQGAYLARSLSYANATFELHGMVVEPRMR